VLGTSSAGSMASSNVARVYDTFLSTGTNRTSWGLRPPNAGNTSTTASRCTPHRQPRAGEAIRRCRLWKRRTRKSGIHSVRHRRGSQPIRRSGRRQQQRRLGGLHALPRQRGFRPGTIKIDGGAPSTTSTTAQLTLSASNPTAGDPLGGDGAQGQRASFGSWKPYSTSATVTVPATEGKQTISVLYRNGAGGVSTPATASIYLVLSPPTVSSVSPSAGSPGARLTINETHFAPDAKVKFGALASPSVTFVSGTQLKAAVPNGAVTGKIAGDDNPGYREQFDQLHADAVDHGAESGGGPRPGRSLTITGAGFNSTSTVKFHRDQRTRPCNT